jgi:3-deoxy-D-arabino-heptulosonate 7-phosphate (DAHP) synthase
MAEVGHSTCVTVNIDIAFERASVAELDKRFQKTTIGGHGANTATAGNIICVIRGCQQPSAI